MDATAAPDRPCRCGKAAESDPAEGAVDRRHPPSPPVPAPNPSTARISVNGTPELVDLSKTFPSSDPVFRLVALTRTTAKIGVAGGSLSTGDGTTTLTKGKKVTLMNTADGTRYELVLLAVS